MNKTEFFRQLEKKIEPFYFFTGEQYFVSVAIEKLKEKIFPDRNLSGIVSFYADECEIDEIIKNIKNVSLFSNKKMLILKRAESLTKEKIEAILPIVDEPPPLTFIIIVAEGEMKNKSLIERISEKYGTVVKFPEFKKVNELREFIMEEIKDAGINIDYDAVNMLMEFSGNSLFNIKNEIEKLKISFKNKKNISLNDVEESLFADMKEDFYGIFNGICARDAVLAMRSFRSVIKKEDEFFPLLGSISTYLLGLYSIRWFIERGLNEDEIFSQSGEHNRWTFNAKFRGAQNYTVKELYSALKKLAKIDVMLKSSSVNKFALFDDFFLSLDKRVRTNF